MPKLPIGMYRRGRSYYYRTQQGAVDLRRSLGTDFEQAKRRYRALIRRSPFATELPTMTVKQAMDRWLTTAIALRRIESGQRDVAARVRRYVLPCLGHLVVAEITPDDVLRYRVTLERKGLRVTLVRRLLSDVRAFFRWAAYEARLIAEPPVPRRLLPRLQETFPKRLIDKEVTAITAIREPYGFIVRLGLASGLRWGELSRLQSRDIQRGVIHLAQTKSGKVRRIPLPPEILRELASRVGRLVPFAHPGTFARQVRKFSGVARFHVHMLRHTFACRWVEAGGNLAVLQELLGHSSIVVTQRYGRPSDDIIRAEVLRIAEQSGTGAGTAASRTLEENGVREVLAVAVTR